MPYKDPKKQKEYYQEYGRKNKKKIKAYQHKRQKDKPEARRVYNRQRRTGWSPEQFNKALIKQNYKCDICYKPLVLGKSTHADHEHVSPPKPRGILCVNCNSGIGFLKEDLEIFKSAIKYLRKHRK